MLLAEIDRKQRDLSTSDFITHKLHFADSLSYLRQVSYMINQTLWLLLISPCNLMWLLFKSSVLFSACMGVSTARIWHWCRRRWYRSYRGDRKGRRAAGGDRRLLVCIPYMTELTPRLLLISARNLVWLLFESGVYSRAASISLSAGAGWKKFSEKVNTSTRIVY